LAGLSLVFTGELTSYSREEAIDLAKRFGAQVFISNQGPPAVLMLITAGLCSNHPVELTL
jgi:BRCT domain type II-containing protein